MYICNKKATHTKAFLLLYINRRHFLSFAAGWLSWEGCWRYLQLFLQLAHCFFIPLSSGHTKTDEFSEKFQKAFDPPHFRKNHIANFSRIHDRITVYNDKWQKYAIQIFGLEMTPPLLELFRKFIRFFMVTRPLLPLSLSLRHQNPLICTASLISPHCGRKIRQPCICPWITLQ